MTSSGVLVVDKPAGWTSHQVVGRCRRLLGTRKVGHAGTLDPMATGVLIVGFGRATRLLGLLALHDKRYLATIRLGVETSTEDAEGEVTASPGAHGIPDEQIRAACSAFVGTIQQVPSAVSAIKVDGKRAYARVRAGEQVELAPREVTVSRFDVTAVRHGADVIDVDVDVVCSSGTYVRALARDVGRRLGPGGHITALRRTRIGGYTLADATLDGAGLEAGERPQVMSMAEAARRSFPVVAVDADDVRRISYGQALDLPLDGLTALVDGDDRLLALYRPAGDQAVAQAVLTGSGEDA